MTTKNTVTEKDYGSDFNTVVFNTLVALNATKGVKEYHSEDIALTWLREVVKCDLQFLGQHGFNKVVKRVDMELLALVTKSKGVVKRGLKDKHPVFSQVAFPSTRLIKGFILNLTPTEIANKHLEIVNMTHKAKVVASETKEPAHVDPKPKKGSEFVELDMSLFSKGLSSKLLITLEDLVRIHGDHYFTSADVALRIIERYAITNVKLVDPEDMLKGTLLVSNALSAKCRGVAQEICRSEAAVAPVYAKVHFPRTKNGIGYKPFVETAIETKPERNKAKVFADALVDAGTSVDGGVTKPLNVIERARTMMQSETDPLLEEPSTAIKDLPNRNICESENRIFGPTSGPFSGMRDNPVRRFGETEIKPDKINYSSVCAMSVPDIKAELSHLSALELVDVLAEVQYQLRKRLDV